MEEEIQDIKVCRICLETGDVNKFYSLYEKYESLFIYEHINTIAHVSIKKDDGRPNKICSKCLVDLKTCVNFKTKCESSNEMYNNWNSTNASADVIVKKEEFDSELEIELHDDYHFKVVDTISLAKLKEFKYNENSEELPQCHDCGESFKSKCKLRVHWKNSHLPKSFICKTCRRVFKTAKSYNKHMKSSPGPCSELAGGIGVRVEGEGKSRMFYCSQCEYKSYKMLHLRTHLVTHSGQRLFECDICHRTYTQRGSLISHKESIHSGGTFVRACHICGKTFCGRRRLYKHLKIHSEENYQCDICKKDIKGKKSLQMHMLRHSGIKAFTCEECAASFYTLAELCNHKKKHIPKVKSLKCELCEYRTATKYAMKKHMWHHISGDKPFSCKVCGNFFTTLQKLTSHEKVHFETQKYACPLCSKLFFCKRSISKHVISIHNSRILQNRGTILTVTQKRAPVELNNS